MPELSRYLRRFRRLVSPPGRPAPAAVPADRDAQRAEELAEVFVAIDELDMQSQGIVAQAEADAAARIESARTDAQAVLSEARREADEARASAAAKHKERSTKEMESLLADAGDEADRVRRVSKERMPALVRDALAALESLGEGGGG